MKLLSFWGESRLGSGNLTVPNELLGAYITPAQVDALLERMHKLRVFSQFTVPSRTCFESVGTTSKQFTIDSSGTERSLTGERRRVRLEKGGTRLPSGPRPLGGP